jgi:PAS domain S-box-containing protein
MGGIMATELDPRMTVPPEKRNTGFRSNSVRLEPGAAAEVDFLSRIFDSMEVLLVVLDRNGNIVRFNQACERMFGYSSNQILAKLTTGELPLPSELRSPEVGALKDLLIQMRKGKQVERYETEWRGQDGRANEVADRLSVATISWSIQVLLDRNNEVEYVFAAGIDITSRKQAEILLEHEHSLLQGLIDSIPDLIFYKDRSGVYLGCNAAFERFKNCSTQDIVNRTDADLYETDLARSFLESDQQVLSRGQPICYENWTADRFARPILFETRKTPLYGPHGELLGVIGIGRDITKHRMVEDDLRAAKAEMEDLVSSLSSALIVLNDEAQVTRWTPAAQSLFGIPAGETAGRRLSEIPIKWAWPVIVESLERCRKERRAIFPEPIRFVRKDGREGFLGINFNPVRVGAEGVSGFILLCSDITERKILENRLSQAQKLESIGQLAAGIAHEINTPIQYVRDNADFLQTSFQDVLALLQKYGNFLSQVKSGEIDTGELRSRSITALEQAVDGADLQFLLSEIPVAIEQSLDGILRVSEIVRAMKEFSHPGVKEKTPLDINQALRNTLAVTRNEWKYIAEVETNFCEDLPKVVCLPGAINQVFLNIIVNAAQAIGAVVEGTQGKGVIDISTHWEGNWVEVRIRDSGTGISEEVREHMFEPFFTTKEVGKGTGQGLSIAYDVVERKHGGSISFETQIGQGTTFLIRLPIEPLN